MELLKRRKALSKLLILLTVIVVSGAVSCCSLGHRNAARTESVNAHDSFVFILAKNYTKRCMGQTCAEKVLTGSGSGFSVAVTKDHTIAATAGHLCMPDDGTYKQEFTATVLGGATYPAITLFMSPETDTCIIAIKGVNVKPLRISNSDVSRGDKVFAMGAPFGLFDNEMVAKFDGYFAGPTEGVIPKGVPGSELRLFGYSIPARPGSSGGPILNQRGEVVGMIVMAHPMFEHFALSPRQDELRFVLNLALVAARSL